MGNVERRLDRLEAKTNGVHDVHFCWLEEGESEAAALARRWPDGPPRGTIIFVCWESGPRDKTICARSTDGKPCLTASLEPLTLPRETITLPRWRRRRRQIQHT